MSNYNLLREKIRILITENEQLKRERAELNKMIQNRDIEANQLVTMIVSDSEG